MMSVRPSVSLQNIKEMLLARRYGRGRGCLRCRTRMEERSPPAVIHRRIALTQHHISICAKSCTEAVGGRTVHPCTLLYRARK